MGDVGIDEGDRKLAEAAIGEGEFSVEIERRGGEAAERDGELGREG